MVLGSGGGGGLNSSWSRGTGRQLLVWGGWVNSWSADCWPTQTADHSRLLTLLDCWTPPLPPTVDPCPLSWTESHTGLKEITFPRTTYVVGKHILWSYQMLNNTDWLHTQDWSNHTHTHHAEKRRQHKRAKPSSNACVKNLILNLTFPVATQALNVCIYSYSICWLLGRGRTHI